MHHDGINLAGFHWCYVPVLCILQKQQCSHSNALAELFRPGLYLLNEWTSWNFSTVAYHLCTIGSKIIMATDQESEKCPHPAAQHANGQPSTSANGVKNGHANGKKYEPPVTKVSKPPAAKGSPVGAFLQLRKASRRPLPTEMGDGSYRAVVKRPSLIQDIRSIGLKGTAKPLLNIGC